MELLRSLRGKLRSIRGMSAAERRVAAEAVVCLGFARLLILLIPPRRLMPLLARRATQVRSEPDLCVQAQIRGAVTLAARHVPWNAVCLPQAIAGRLMLARRGCSSTLHCGVGRGADGGLVAHAWLESNGAVILGEDGMSGVTAVARFV